MTSTIDITTICPECGQDHPVSQSHRRRGRYLCVEGTNAGGPHRFVLISTTGEMVAEADTIEEGVAAAEYLTGEQGRTILCVEAGAWEERLAIVRDLTRKRARMADGIHYAGLAGMPAEPINSARVDLLDEIVMALSIWTPTAEVIS